MKVCSRESLFARCVEETSHCMHKYNRCVSGDDDTMLQIHMHFECTMEKIDLPMLQTTFGDVLAEQKESNRI